MFSRKSSHKKTQSSSEKPSDKKGKKTKTPNNTGASCSTIHLTIFVFRGQPDVYYKRHVLVYFTSPEIPSFHETVHARRKDETSRWELDQIHGAMNWPQSLTYLSHVNAGAVQVSKGAEMVPVNIIAATPVQGRDQDSGWNCQNFLLEGLQGIVNYGLQTQEWYQFVEEELVDHLLDGASA
ncbi:hypothetical protein NOR_04339 [Metarhizium rileyi]|uniref:Uncharacterized protein n=1 Tax=Metarhizium rileyi (strain RCEF 4871) TaxID=1649241 RepID=A0A167EE35_METRR|nr:hypothetical protein NOR_04339 [Metarhizium rileyi RCEF 4871]TWU78623.1 hypothetical protein ED733_005104 [Metarhizium rileyi]